MKKWSVCYVGAGLVFAVGIFVGFLDINFTSEKRIFASNIFTSSTHTVPRDPTPTPFPDPVHVPILMYHYVEVPPDPKDTVRRSLGIFPATFESQLATLLAHGYSPIFMRDLASYFEGKYQLPAKPIVLTFDDGYRDFYTDAFPILQKYHAKATAYVISGFLGFLNYMTNEQVQAIASSGLVEVAAHTAHHVYLKGENVDLVAKEIGESKIALEALIHEPVTDFAYPYGAFDESAVQAVSHTGFATAVSTKPGVEQSKNTRFILPRLRPGGRTGDALISWLESTNHNQDMW